MRKPRFKKVSSSIRTHFGVLTSAILLALLLVFYLGGRYILINIIRQAEKEVTNVSNDIKRVIYSQSEALKTHTLESAKKCTRLAEGEPFSIFLRQLINTTEYGAQTHLSILLDSDGTALEGFYLGEQNTVQPIESKNLARYFADPTRADALITKKRMPVSGLINFLKTPYHISIAPIYAEDGGIKSYLCIGSLVQGNLLFKRIAEMSHGLSVHLKTKVMAEEPVVDATGSEPGLPAPIFQDDQIFAAGSQWHIGGNQFEAVIPIYDILGKEISSLSISFPRSFASLTTIALGWLTFFVSVVGIVFIAPVFWLQSRIILDPLSKLEQQIYDIRKKYKDNKIEYLNYTSNDEFGSVARSVDTLLRELNNKSQEILANAQRHKALITSIPDCLCIFSVNAMLASMEKHPENVAPIPGLKLTEPLSSKFFQGKHILLFEKALTQSIETGEVINIALTCCDATSTPRYFETWSATITF